MVDYWKTIKSRPLIQTGYSLWTDIDRYGACISHECGRRTSLAVMLDGAPATHVCSLECMEGDLLEEVLNSVVKGDNNVTVSQGTQAAGVGGPVATGQEGDAGSIPSVNQRSGEAIDPHAMH